MLKQAVEMDVAAAQPGMEVAIAVVDAGERVLLPAGAVLSEAAIASLQRRDIATVTVLVEQAEDPEVAAAQRARIGERLDHLFRKAGEGEATRALYAAVLAYRLEARP